MNRTEASFAVRRDDRVLAMLGLADCVVPWSLVYQSFSLSVSQ